MKNSKIPSNLELWPIFSYITFPKTTEEYPENINWLYFKDVPDGDYANLSIGQLIEFLRCETLNPKFSIDREQAVFIREYLWNQEKHFRNKDWRNAFGKYYEMIFQA